MINLSLNQRERAGLYGLLKEIPWGGDEASLLERNEVYEALKLEEFETLTNHTEPDGSKALKVDALSKSAQPYKLSPKAAEHLAATIGSVRLQMASARLIVPVLARLRAQLTAAAPKGRAKGGEAV